MAQIMQIIMIYLIMETICPNQLCNPSWVDLTNFLPVQQLRYVFTNSLLVQQLHYVFTNFLPVQQLHYVLTNSIPVQQLRVH